VINSRRRNNLCEDSTGSHRKILPNLEPDDTLMGRGTTGPSREISRVIWYSPALIYVINKTTDPLVFLKNVIVNH
jgi:hypothetical protein